MYFSTPSHPTGAASNGSTPNRRIIHVPRRFVAHEWGGTETVVLELAKQQRLAGWDPQIITSMALAKTKRDTISNIPVERYRHSYPFFGLSQHDIELLDKKGGNLLSLGLFRSLLRQRHTRLYHAHSLKRLGGMVRTAARVNHKPYVVTLHGGVYDVPEAERESLIRPIKGKFEWGRPFGALFGSRRVLEDANLVICVGQREREIAAQQLTHDRVITIPNGVDANRFAHGDGPAFRQQHGIPSHALLLLNIARLDPQKNQLLLLQAFRHIVANHPQAHLLLIGPETHPAYAQELRTYLQNEQLQGFVTIIPGLDGSSPALINAYHSADIFVLPSRHEPFGIAVLEAWAAGLPVIVSDVGGLTHLVQHGSNGLRFSPQGPQADIGLAAAILSLANAPSHRTHLGEAGRLEALSRYSWPVIHQQVETAYRQAEAHARSLYHIVP